MIAHFLRGYSWEPAPVFDLYVSDPAAALGGGGRAVAAAPSRTGVAAAACAALEQQPARAAGRAAAGPTELSAERSYLRLAGDEGSPEPGVRGAVAHLRRYHEALVDRARSGAVEDAPAELYFVDGTDQAIREVVGFRLRGHPMALMGAFIFPRHRRSPEPHGRPSLTSFFSKPPRVIGYSVAPVPPGHTIVFLPDVAETVPEFMARLRGHGGSAVGLDANVIDVAFDLRFRNPSEIRHHSYRGARPTRSVFRTIAGHVVSGVSVGLTQTLHTDDRFVTLTDAIQHRPDGDVRIPTIAVNRSILALQSQLPEGQPEDAVRATLAFHPATATPEHILGAPYDEV